MGNRHHKSSQKHYDNVVILPRCGQPWELLYSGTTSEWHPTSVFYGLDKFCYLCKEIACNRESVCMKQMRATNNCSKKTLGIERFGEQEVIVHYGKCHMTKLMASGYSLNKSVADYRWNTVLLVLCIQSFQENFHTFHFNFPLVNLETGRVTGILAAPHKNMTVIHCHLSPDCQHTAILFYSRSEETRLYTYDLYLYSNETQEIVDCITINHEVHPYIAFDSRHKWSRIAIANFECKDVGIKNELVTYSIKDHAIIARSKTSLPEIFLSSHFNLLYSKDGEFLILQKLSDNRFGSTYTAIYIFDSDRLFIMKYLTANLPTLINSMCRMNFEPIFSLCGSYMRLVNHENSGDDNPTVQIYQVPRRPCLQSLCRVVILQSVGKTEDLWRLPLPKPIQEYLSFKPLEI